MHVSLTIQLFICPYELIYMIYMCSGKSWFQTNLDGSSRSVGYLPPCTWNMPSLTTMRIYSNGFQGKICCWKRNLLVYTILKIFKSYFCVQEASRILLQCRNFLKFMQEEIVFHLQYLNLFSA